MDDLIEEFLEETQPDRAIIDFIWKFAEKIAYSSGTRFTREEVTAIFGDAVKANEGMLKNNRETRGY